MKVRVLSLFFKKLRGEVHAVTLGSHSPKVGDERSGLGAETGVSATHPAPTFSPIRIVVGPQNVRVAFPPEVVELYTIFL
ncbi:MAG: hypothetical protein C6I01_00695 [Epsilonproteobacteria bacterium]|nr:hypothetical protein [Campylobacterota bacterium]